MSFAKNKRKNIGKNKSKNLSNKYSHKFLDHATQSAPDAPKTISRKAIQKRAKASDDVIGNKIADKITKQSSSDTFTNAAENIRLDRGKY